MKIVELIKDLAPVTIIEFKNYVVENLGEICKTRNLNSKIISNHRYGEAICKNCKVKMNKNGKINISKINVIHSQLETWLSKFR